MIGSGWALPSGLALLAATLCAVIGFELTGQTQDHGPLPRTRVTIPLQTTQIAIPETTDQRDAWFKEVVSRPLFSPDRRPVGPEAREVRGLPRLTGIITNGPRRIAIFAAPSGGRLTVVEVGSHVGAYDVHEIEESGVTVVGPEGTTVIRPIFDAAPAPAVPGRPPAVPRPEPAKPPGR